MRPAHVAEPRFKPGTWHYRAPVCSTAMMSLLISSCMNCWMLSNDLLSEALINIFERESGWYEVNNMIF